MDFIFIWCLDELYRCCSYVFFAQTLQWEETDYYQDHVSLLLFGSLSLSESLKNYELWCMFDTLLVHLIVFLGVFRWMNSLFDMKISMIDCFLIPRHFTDTLFYPQIRVVVLVCLNATVSQSHSFPRSWIEFQCPQKFHSVFSKKCRSFTQTRY